MIVNFNEMLDKLHERWGELLKLDPLTAHLEPTNTTFSTVENFLDEVPAARESQLVMERVHLHGLYFRFNLRPEPGKQPKHWIALMEVPDGDAITVLVYDNLMPYISTVEDRATLTQVPTSRLHCRIMPTGDGTLDLDNAMCVIADHIATNVKAHYDARHELFSNTPA